MLFHAKNGTLDLDGSAMDYIRFGSGPKHLIMLPGLGDGLRSVKGTALPMAMMYRIFAKDYTVWVFSRKNSLSPGCTTRDMARDQARAMELLGIRQAHIFGVSMGGMIAQWLAIDHPEKVDQLILCVTASRPNPILTGSVTEWIALARSGDHAAFMESNLRRIYSKDYYRKNRWLTPLLGRLTRPGSYGRFFVQADACLTHDTSAHLHRISAPTFVIGGEQDMALGGDPSRELAAAIPGATLKMYPQWGHGLYEEARDFNRVLLEHLR